jgi:hypothetical protein
MAWRAAAASKARQEARLVRDLSFLGSPNKRNWPQPPHNRGMSVRASHLGRSIGQVSSTSERPGMTADPAPLAAPSRQPLMRQLIVAATIGNIFEWFDFVIYGFFAVTIAEVFFPVGNPTVSFARYLRRVRSCLFHAAVGCDRHRRLYRPRRTQSRPVAVDRIDDDRYDLDGGDAGLRDDRPCGTDHYYPRPSDSRSISASLFSRSLC